MRCPGTSVVSNQGQMTAIIQLKHRNRITGGREFADGDRGKRLGAQRGVGETVRVVCHPGAAPEQTDVEPAFKRDPAPGKPRETAIIANQVPAMSPPCSEQSRLLPG